MSKIYAPLSKVRTTSLSRIQRKPRFFSAENFSRFKQGALLCATVLTVAVAPRSAHANYRVKAIEATDYIQHNFFDAQAGLYHAAFPIDPKALPYDFMWGNGIQFSVLAGAVQYEPDRYRPALNAFTQGINRYWDKDAKIPGFDAYFSSPDGDDKYYDDNAWLVLGFTEAYQNTKDARYLDWAKRTQQFVLSGWDDKLGGGLYWHQQEPNGKNTCVSAPAAAGALGLYAVAGNKDDLAWGQRLYTWTCAHLQDKDGLFWDNINLNGKIERTKWTYNTALMIRANLGLYRALKDAKYLTEARRLADSSIREWGNASTTGAFANSARFNHLLDEALIQTYEATENVKYLNAARRDADFGYRYVRDVQNGGYWNDWAVKNHKPDERKTMIENASVARLFWVLTPYPDVEQLRSLAAQASDRGDTKAALDYSQQALNSTAGTPPTEKPKAVA